MRWPRPCRARNATSLPASLPDHVGDPKACPRACRSPFLRARSNPGIEYNPLPPIIPMLGFILVSVPASTPPVEDGMHEDVEMPARAGARLVQQARALRLQPLDGRGQIRHLERDVMQPFAALLDKFRDHRIRRPWLPATRCATRRRAASRRSPFPAPPFRAGSTGEAELLLDRTQARRRAIARRCPDDRFRIRLRASHR